MNKGAVGAVGGKNIVGSVSGVANASSTLRSCNCAKGDYASSGVDCGITGGGKAAKGSSVVVFDLPTGSSGDAGKDGVGCGLG